MQSNFYIDALDNLEDEMLHYRIIESKKQNKTWVVFIHPLGGSSATYYNQVRTFSKAYNLLLIDLHGHGKSAKGIRGLTTNDIGQDILSVLDHLDISKAHFVGMCLGNVVVDLIYDLEPNRILSIVYGAAVKEIDLKNRMLLKAGNISKNLLPHTVLYSLFAHLMMPKSNHKEARDLFVRECNKMKRSDFLDWYNLIMNAQDFYVHRCVKVDQVRKLYLFGSEDYLFINKAQGYVDKDHNAQLKIINQVGHMCNVESPESFNRLSMEFINQNQIVEENKKAARVS